MAAAAATTTAALSSCSKRESSIMGAGVPKKAKRDRSPPEAEVEAFLVAAERSVALRYNYDIVKDAPMNRRYEWVRVTP